MQKPFRKAFDLKKPLRILASITAVVILLLAVAGIWLNHKWSEVKKANRITYQRLDISLNGKIRLSVLTFDVPELVFGNLDTAYIDLDILSILRGQFSVSAFTAKNGSLYILASETESDDELPEIKLNSIELSNISVVYFEKDTIMDFNSGEMRIHHLSTGQIPEVRDFHWVNGQVKVFSPTQEPATGDEGDSTISLTDLPKFKLQNFDIRNLNLEYHTDSSVVELNKFETHAFNLSHKEVLELHFEGLNGIIGDTLPLTLAIAQATWNERDVINSNEINSEIPGISVKIRKLTIQPNRGFEYHLELDKSRISYKGLTMAYHHLDELMNPILPRNSMVTFSGTVSGNSKQLTFKDFQTSLLNETEVTINGKLDWSDAEGSIDLSLDNLKTSGNDVSLFLAPMAYNQFFNWPTRAFGKAAISGNFNHYLITGNLGTPHGPLVVNTVVDFPNAEDIFYDIIVSSENLKVNEIVDYLAVDIPLGKIRAEMAGLYSDISQRDTFLLSLDLFSFTVEDYNLSNLKFYYYFNNAYDSLWGHLNDTALAANIKGAYYGGDTSAIPFTGTIYKAIPGLLDSLVPKWNYHGHYSGTYKYDDADFFQISLQMDDHKIKWSEGGNENLKDLSLDVTAHGDDYNIAVSAGDKNKLELSFPYPDYNFENLGWLQVMDSMEFFALDATLNVDSTFMQKFMGMPFSISLEELSIDHHRQQHSWNVAAIVPHLSYGDVIVESLSSYIKTSTDTMNALIEADAITYSGVPIQEPTLDLEQKDGKLIWRVSSLDINNLGPTNIHSVQTITDEGYLFNFVETDTLVLIGHPWTVSNNQGILFTKDYKLHGGNLELRQDQARLGLETEDQDLMTFHIDSIALLSLVAPFVPEIKLDGYLQSDIRYRVSTNQAGIQARVVSVIIDSMDLGNWMIKGSYADNKALINIENTTLKGGLKSDIKYENSQIDYKFHIQNFDLGFLNNALQDADLRISGLLNGEITGVYIDELDTRGWLQINQGTFDIPYLQTSVSLDQDSILFKDKRLVFHQFHVKDPNGNPIYVNGLLDLLPNLEYDLTIKGDNYTFLDQSRGELISGRASASIDLILIGTPAKTTASGKLNILPGSYITYTLSDEVTAVKRGGDILFVSFKHADTVVQLQGTTENELDLDIDFVLDKTNFEIILNPVTQEYLKLDATGKLNLSKDGYSAPLLFGQLASNSGRSRIDLPIVPPTNLDIEKASVRWGGPYDDPSISFKGTEEFKTSMDGVLSMEHRKDLVPVTLEIKLNDAHLNSIDFVFDLSSTDQELDSYLKSRTAEEREQFATNLLLFGTLSTEGSDGSDKVLNMYTSKLNEIANRNLKNTDLVLGVDNETEYNSKGQEVSRTKLNYSLRRGFYNDRAFISVGGDLGLYSDQGIDPGKAASHFIGNISLDYQLFDGRPLWVKAARNERYAGVIDGDIVEYRLGIGFYKTYPTFWSIFGQDKATREDDDD